MKTSHFHPSAASLPSINQSTDVFIYFGDEIDDIQLSTFNNESSSKMRQFLSSHKVPKDAIKVLIHPWVKVIPNGTFSKRDRLQEVQFGFAKGKGDSAGNSKCADAFGMTPLHLVACSACPNPIGSETANKYIKEYEGNGGFSDEMKLGGKKGKPKRKSITGALEIISCLTESAVKSR